MDGPAGRLAAIAERCTAAIAKRSAATPAGRQRGWNVTDTSKGWLEGRLQEGSANLFFQEENLQFSPVLWIRNEFSEFWILIQAKVPDPSGSGSNPCYLQ